MTPTALEIRDLPSPNHGPRRPGAAIDMLVLHYTGMRTAGAALDRLRDPAAKVSAHYLVDEAGAVFRLVPEERRAWHAGRAFWAGETDVNGRSIGIELANPGHRHGYRPFPEAQMAALEALCRDILSRRAVPAGRVLGHSDVAPGRKPDPGELFDWRRLARAGSGPGRRPRRRPPASRPGRFPRCAAASPASATPSRPAATTWTPRRPPPSSPSSAAGSPRTSPAPGTPRRPSAWRKWRRQAPDAEVAPGRRAR